MRRWTTIPPLVLAVVLTSGGHMFAAADLQTTGIREVSASDKTLIPLQTRLRFTTMIVLPDGEDILDVICGDRDFWVISATRNIVHVKPAKEAATTNLNLVTNAGAVYSFLLTEKSGAGMPDLKIYVHGDDRVDRSKPKYYTAAEVQGLQADLVDARAAVDAARRQAADAVSQYRDQYPAKLQFPFGPVKYERPFLVRAIWTDGQSTYIRSDASELAAVYEVKDGAPALINFDVRNGTYVIPKVMEGGYLAIGKERFPFARTGR
jgi:type IV secretion system protein VirB9